MGKMPDSFLIYFSPSGGIYYSESTEIAEAYFNKIIYPANNNKKTLERTLNEHEGESDVGVFVTVKKKMKLI